MTDQSVINKIFSKITDEDVHRDFTKYSKGEFPTRYLVQAKKQATRYSIKTSAEFTKFFVRYGMEKATGPVKVKGAIIGRTDIREDIDFEIERIKQFAGVKQAVINTEVDPDQILKLMDKHARAFFALSFSIPDFDLKVKAKSPKSGKASKKKDEAPKADFCTLKTNDPGVIKDLFFDVPDFKEIEIEHVFNITDIEIDTSIKDPREMREAAIRKGKMIRKIKADGKESSKEIDFTA